MIDPTTARERIELALRELPFCPCGAPTAPVGRSGGVWLRCASLTPPRRPLRRLLALDLLAGHTDRRLVDPAAASPPRAVAGHP